MMNTIKPFILTGMLAAASLLVLSCESFDEMNTDPTRMSEASAGSFVKPILYNMAVYNWNRYNSWTFPLMQCVVSTSSTGGTGWYVFSDAAGDGMWTACYKWATNAQTVRDKAVAEGDANYEAIAVTLQSWMFQLLTDAFGDIPMEEACRGEQQLYYPRFNTQTEVYAALIKELGRANDLYKEATGLKYNTSGDMLYCTSATDKEGMARWRKFNNSLRLRVLLRVVEVEELNAAAEIRRMLADPQEWPLFESNADNAAVSISGVAPEEAPLTRPADFTSYKVLSSFFIDRLKEWNDPRLAVFAKKATNGGVSDYYGIESGYSVLPEGSFSQPHTDNLAVAPMELQLMTYAELCFIEAELAQRGIYEADAARLYEEGVAASAEQWGTALSDDYFENPAAAYDGTLRRIMEQKFYALFFCDFQQWFEYNRTGWPEVPVGPGVASGNGMPRRFKYPAILQRTNLENYQEAKSRMGGDDFDIRLIWQK